MTKKKVNQKSSKSALLERINELEEKLNEFEFSAHLEGELRNKDLSLILDDLKDDVRDARRVFVSMSLQFAGDPKNKFDKDDEDIICRIYEILNRL